MRNGSAAANVVDLDAFRQKKRMREPSAMPAQTFFVPVWFCWMPLWAPVLA